MPCSDWHDAHITTTPGKSIYNSTESIKIEFSIYCASVGTNYTIAYKAYESNSSTAYHLSGVVYQTVVATGSNTTITVDLGTMSPGNYSVNTSMYNTTYDSSTSFSTYNGSSHNSAHFFVRMQPTSGNQTGNNTTTPQVTIEMDYFWGPWYSSGSTATAYINSTDLTINKQYRVGWELEQLSPTISIVDDGNFTWTATSTTDQRVVSFTPSDGSYLAWAWLHEVVNSTSQTWLDTDATNFTIGNSSTSTGGNNSGGINTGTSIIPTSY